jgi:hypothetical protein
MRKLLLFFFQKSNYITNTSEVVLHSQVLLTGYIQVTMKLHHKSSYQTLTYTKKHINKNCKKILKIGRLPRFLNYQFCRVVIYRFEHFRIP